MSSHVSKQPPEPTLFFGVEERDRRRRVFAGVGSRHPEDAWLRGAGDEMGGGGRWRRREGKGMDEEYIPGSQPVLPFFQPPRWSLRTLMGSNHPPDAAHERLPHHERRAMACTGDGGTIDTDCDGNGPVTGSGCSDDLPGASSPPRHAQETSKTAENVRNEVVCVGLSAGYPVQRRAWQSLSEQAMGPAVQPSSGQTGTSQRWTQAQRLDIIIPCRL
ncbi:hypothetical protein PtB15_5B598 [Puccinia triticina]|nr:hypothetical protein PtB15_5B598 [Puccinia triticina]